VLIYCSKNGPVIFVLRQNNVVSVPQFLHNWCKLTHVFTMTKLHNKIIPATS